MFPLLSFLYPCKYLNSVAVNSRDIEFTSEKNAIAMKLTIE
jgi:hypothetical protein